MKNTSIRLAFVAILACFAALSPQRASAATSFADSPSGTVDTLSPLDSVTQTPTLTAPATNAVTGSPVSVDFTLPEAALNGSVTLSFGGTVLTLANTQGAAGPHSFTFSPANPTASAQVASGAAVVDGTYTVTLSYQDALGNPAASASSTNVTIDTVPPSITTNQTGAVTTTNFIVGPLVGQTETYHNNGHGIAVSGYSGIGELGIGVMNHTGGTHTTPLLYVGNAAGSSGTYALSGGTLAAGNAFAGNGGNGAINQTGGAFTATLLRVAAQAGSTGSYALSGGTATVTTFDTGSGTPSVSLIGGTFTATNTSLSLGAGGLVVGDGMNAVTLKLGSGNHSVSGSGIHVLANATMELGGGTISALPVALEGGTLRSNTALAPTAVSQVGDISATAGSVVNPGAHTSATWQTGSLSLVAGVTLKIEYSGTHNGGDVINVAGTVALNGATLEPKTLPGPASGNTHIFIVNDGSDAVIGTFAGLPEGGVMSVVNVNNGETYYARITYQGGDGNDVALIFGTVPTVYSTLAGAFTATSMILNAVVNPAGAPTSVVWEYGPTTSYGATTASVSSAESGDSAVGFSMPISGLLPHTAYHVRVVATNAFGTTTGSDTVLNTLNRLPSGGNTLASVTAGQTLTVTLPFTTPDLDGDTVTVTGVSGGAGVFSLGTLSGNQVPVSGLAPGAATLTFTVSDGFGGTSEGTVWVTVTSADPVLSEIAAKGASAAGLTNAKFVSFGNPAVNTEGHTAFYATVTGNTLADTTALMGKTKGIWADDSTGTRQLIARVGDTAVGTSSAVFSAMSDPVYNGNEEVAFRGTLKTGVGGVTSTPALTANNFGIWSNTGGTLHLVAQRGAQAPGCPSGATFSAFTQIVLPDQGGVVLLANLNSGTVALPGPGGVTPANNIGIWAVDTAGDLQLVVRKGDIHPANGKAITALSFLPAPTGVSGQSRNFSQSTGDLLYRANFSDSTTGVFTTLSTAVLVPGQLIVDDQFTTSIGRPLPPQILTSAPQNVNLPGGVWSGKGAVGSYGNPEVVSFDGRQALKLISDIGVVVPLMGNARYVKPKLIRLQTTFNLGTTTGVGTTRTAGLGFWSSAAEELANSYLGFYGVTVDRDGSVKLNLNPSDFTPLVSESLPNAGVWSASAWHTLAFSVNTNTGEIFDVMMDGVAYNFATPVSAFTNANTNYAGILVSSVGGGQYLYIDSFQVAVDSGEGPDATSGVGHPVVMKGAGAAGITNAKFTSFGYPTMNDEGNTAFYGTVTGTSAAATTALMGNTTGIWADDNSGARQLVVRKGDTAAGTGGAIFSAFSDPVYNVNEEIAFKGTLKVGVGSVTSTPALTANNNGIWSNTGGTLHLVAQRGAQAPGCPTGATFSAFTSFVLPDQGGVVMLANLNSGTVALPGPGGVTGANNLGIWAVDMAGELKLVVRKGDTHPANGKTITGLQFLPVSPFVSGQSRNFSQGTGDIVYKATFSDMTTGIYKVVFP